MCAFERDLRNLHDLPLTGTIAKHDLAIADPRALLHFFLPAEPENLRSCPRGDCYAGWVIGIEHGEVTGLLILVALLIFTALLILEDARLCIHIDFEGSMTVEVIGRNVQHHRNFRTESSNRFQLKARDLEDNHRFWLGSVY